MFKYAVIKLILGFQLVVGSITFLPATPPPAPAAGAGGGLCGPNQLSRYEAWVRDEPCLNVRSDLAPAPVESESIMESASPEENNTNDLGPQYYTHLVFSSYRDGNYEIYKAEAPWQSHNLQNSVRMTYHPASDLRPRLRPNSNEILFSSDRSGNYELYLMDWNGNILQQLTAHPAYDSQAAWSPDGSRIAFVSDRDGNQEIYTMLADGSSLTRLTYDGAADFNPSWSPNGSQITWAKAVDQQNGRIYIMSADGSNPYPVTSAIRYVQHPTWDLTKPYIALDYDANGDGFNEISVMKADGSEFHTYYLRSQRDYQVNSWAVKETADVLFNIITYQEYQGQWYITASNLCTHWVSYTPTLRPEEFCFIGSYLDFYPDAAQVDKTAPVSQVAPLPLYMRAGTIILHISGSDTGLAGLYVT